MKKFNLLIIGIVAMFGFMISAKAANSASLTCDKTDVKVGESANCLVSISANAPLSAVTIKLSASEHLGISNVVANTKAGWTASASGTSGNTYSFNNSTGSTGGELFSFTVTLLESAKQLSEGDSCGQICIVEALFDGNQIAGITQGTGTCFAPNITVEQCVGENCNPKTGSFMNYIIIGAVTIIAIAAVVIARKSSKFYRV